jgi:hypothetical protein
VGLWAIQTQLLPQIIANRLSLIMTSKRRAAKLKWALFLSIAGINIAVCYIWTTAQMPSATPYQIHVNHMFEKAEKTFFLVIDLSLNLYFLYLVRFRLIADGLGKYWMLFNFNAGIVVISTSMDALLLGFLSLPDPYLSVANFPVPACIPVSKHQLTSGYRPRYVQFAPLAYIVKLYIELLMASLISKVVRSGAAERGDGWHSSSRTNNKSNPAHRATSQVVITGNPGLPKSGNHFFSRFGKDAEALGDGSGSEIELATDAGHQGILIETTVALDSCDEGRSEKTSTSRV